jgi:hypothetical protein
VTQGEESLHTRFCANRSALAAGTFVAFCGIETLYSLRAVGNPTSINTGAFFLSFQAYVLLVIGYLFVQFKCARERVVLGLMIISCIRALFFGLRPGLAPPLAGLVDWFSLLLWSTALALSLSMLRTALRPR